MLRVIVIGKNSLCFPNGERLSKIMSDKTDFDIPIGIKVYHAGHGEGKTEKKENINGAMYVGVRFKNEKNKVYRFPFPKSFLEGVLKGKTGLIPLNKKPVKTKVGDNNKSVELRASFNRFIETAQNTVIKADPLRRSIINAGPGTGKTWTLIEKIIYMIENNLVEADRILVLCYSRAAVSVIRERLSNVAASGRINYTWKEVEVRTFDSFSTQLIYAVMENWPNLLPPYFNIETAGYDQRIEVATSVMKKKQDLLINYTHIFVDEVQDLVGCRAELVLAMLKGLPDTCGFTVLGDSCQSLYDYLSEKDSNVIPSVKFYLELFQLFPFANYFALTKNYRQDTRYSDLTEPYRKAILTENFTDLADIAKSIHNRISRVKFNSWKDFSNTEAKKFLKNGTLGILTRSNAQALLISSVLRTLRVQHLLKGRHETYQLSAWIADIFFEYPNETIDEAGFLARNQLLFPKLAHEIVTERWNALAETQRNKIKKRFEVADLLKGLLTNAKSAELFKSPDEQHCPITISTIHRAKGMEFDSVIVIDDVIENVFGADADNILEHKVCYVALTRPRRTIKRIEPMRKRGVIYCNDMERFIRKIPSQRPYLKSFEVGFETDLDIDSFAETKERQDDIRKVVKPGTRILLFKCPEDTKSYIVYSIIAVVPDDKAIYHIGYTSKAFSNDLETAIKDIKGIPYFRRLYYNLYPEVLNDIYIKSITTCVSHNTSLPGSKNYGDMSIWTGYTITGFADAEYE